MPLVDNRDYFLLYLICRHIETNPSFEMLQFRGLIVDPSEKELLDDAKQKIQRKKAVSVICGVWSF